MQLTIPRSEIKQAVSGLSRVVPRSYTLPVLGCVRLSVKDGKATATATDLDSNLHYRFQAAQCEGQGIAIVPLAELKPLATGKDSDTITIKTASAALIEVTNTIGGLSVVRPITGLDPDEWPDFNPAVDVGPVEPAFLTNLRRIAPFASSDESRYILNGVYLETGKNDYMVATDGRRLTALNTLKFPFRKGCVIPTTKFLSWGKLATDTLLIGYSEIKDVGWFRLVTPEWDYKVRTRDGNYPNWRQVVPSEAGKHRLTFGEEDVKLLASVLPTFAGHEDHQGGITFNGEPGRLQVIGRGANDPAASTLDLPGSKLEGGAADVTVDRHFFLDALAAGFRSFAFQDNESPMMARDNGGGVHVLMPLRTSHTPPPAKAETPAPTPASEPPKPAAEPTGRNPNTRRRQ